MINHRNLWPYSCQKLTVDWLVSAISKRFKFLSSLQLDWLFKRPRVIHRPRGHVWIDCGGCDVDEWLAVIMDWRYLFQICWMLTSVGYRVYMPLRIPLRGVIPVILRDTLALSGVEYNVESCPQNALRLLGKPAVSGDNCNPKDILLLFDPSVVFESEDQYVTMQYPPHRRTVKSAAWRKRSKIAHNGNRRAGMVFAGSWDKFYGDIICGKPGRKMCLNHLRSLLHSDEYLLIDSGRKFRNIFLKPFKSKVSAFVEFNFSRLPQEWLYILGLSDFFLCLPGRVMPLCHNAIEAMAAGAIPVLSYPEWFFPPLEDGVNCFVYSGEQDLIPVIRKALSLPAPEVVKMRESVLEYYNYNLSEQACVDRLFSAQGKHAVVITEQKIDQLTPHSAVFKSNVHLN